jgi:hypothetical protein
MAMSKKTVYTLFIAKFVFSLAMIFWTIKMTLGAGVGTDDDTTFMSYYQNVDDNYNNLIVANHNFEEKFKVEVSVNDFRLNRLDIDDIYLSQRVIKDRKTRKNLLNIGENSISIKVYDRATNKQIRDYNTEIVFTMPSTHKYNQEFTIKNNDTSTITLEQKTFWNIMGKINIQNYSGQFFIKTNAN